MRYTGGALRRRAAAVRTALVSLVALAAVIIALVLMHGMSGTRTMAAHTPAPPAATAVSTGTGHSASYEPGDHLAEAPALVATGSALRDALPLSSPAPNDQAEAGAGPWLGFAMFILFLLVSLVSLASGLRVMSSRRGILARPRALVRRCASTLPRATPNRLALSIDRR